MPPRRASLLLRLLVVGAPLLGLAALLALCTRSESDRGLVVEVVVLDPESRPVPDAEVQARYAPGWKRADAQGRVRLEDVPLRVGEAPSPAALAVAVDVRARHHALRPGHGPEARRDAQGTWRLRYRLEPHATIRLMFVQSQLPNLRAWVEPDPEGRIQAEDAVTVARPAYAAAWRVFDGLDEVMVRVEGDEGTAAFRIPVSVPPPGRERDVPLRPQPARPIGGQVVLPRDPAPPTGQGRLAVTEILEDGREVARDAVWVGEDGTFAVTYVGEGRFRLEPDLVFVEGVAPVETRSGREVTLRGGRTRPWLEVAAHAWGEVAAGLRLLGLPAEEPVEVPGWARLDEERVLLALPGAGRWRLEVHLPGTDERAPQAGRVDVEVAGAGPTPVDPPLAVLPHGTVEVEVETHGLARGGATVRILGPAPRTRTVLPGLEPVARFVHVPVGRVEVEVAFRDPAASPVRIEAEVQADRTLRVIARPSTP